jgi:hypothetical protein
MPTQQVQITINGTNQSINVAAMQLSADLGLKDFVVVSNGSIVPSTSYNKVAATTIVYSGPALVNENVVLRRRTPAAQQHSINYARRISSNNWTDELMRIYSRFEEVEAFGSNYLGGFVGNGNSVVNNQGFSVDWGSDTIGVSSRKAVYDKFVLVDNALSAANVGIASLVTNFNSLSTTVSTQSSTVASLSSNVQSLTTGQSSLVTRVTSLETNTQRLVFSVKRTTVQSISQNTASVIICNTEVYDPNAWHSNVSGDFTVPSGFSGLYEVLISGNIAASSGITTFTPFYLFNVTDNSNELVGYFTGAGGAAAGSITHHASLIQNKTYRLTVTTAGVAPTVAADVTRPFVFSLSRVL